MGFEGLPDGWRVWNEEPGGRAVLVYRPDVFEGETFPAACLPTIYVTNGGRRARPGAGQRETDEWQVTLFLEPEIEGPTETCRERERAVDAAVAMARRFDGGDVDYRALYQVPREEYFEALDELTGRDR